MVERDAGNPTAATIVPWSEPCIAAREVLMKAIYTSLLLGGLLPPLVTPALAAFAIERAASPRRFDYVAMRLDPSGAPFLTLGKESLFPASPVGASFQIDAIDDESGCLGGFFGSSAIAFDAVTGEPLVAHQSSGLQEIRLARRDAGQWSIETVPGVTWGNQHIALQVDSAGNPAIAWHDEWTKILHLARWDGSAWQVEAVDPIGGRPALLMAGLEPIVAYGDYTDIKYARKVGASWTYETIEPGVVSGYVPSLLIDGSGEPVVAYPNPATQELRVSRRSAGVWRNETVDGGVGTSTAIAYDSLLGILYVAYRDEVGQRMKLATWDGLAWSIAVVDPVMALGDALDWVSLELDVGGAPHLAYVDGVAHEARFARWNGTSWDITVVDDANGDAGWHASSARDATDRVTVVHLDHDARNIDFLENVGGVWTAETVVAGADDWGMIAHAYTPGGRKAFAFFGPVGGLQYAEHDGTSWRIQVAEPNPPFGKGGACALAYDALGRPAIVSAFRDQPSARSEVRLTRFDGSIWGTEIVDGGFGGFDPWDVVIPNRPSLAFDAGGAPAIGYFTPDAVPNVRVAKWDGAIWRISVIDTLSGGYRTDVATAVVPATGELLVAYRQDAPSEVRLARGDGVAPWVLEPFATTPFWGPFL